MAEQVLTKTICDIKVENVSKIYVGRHVNALYGVSLAIDQGDFVAILGPSGCGKSTLLNIIGAVDKPSDGKVRIGGTDLAGLDDDQLTQVRRENLGFVFQFFNLLPTFSVEENVRLPLELSGMKPKQVKEEVDSIIDRVGLSERKTMLPAQLSGGEMQRTALARAIIHNPKIVIADEPTGNLDTENGIKVLELLKQINEESRVTVIMATHSTEAASYARRTIRMRDGKIEIDEKR